MTTARERNTARRRAGTRLLATLGILAALARPAAARVWLVAASEPDLAVPLLVARGAAEPVLLYDPTDHEVLRAALDRAGWRDRACVRGPGAGKTVADGLEELAGHPCQEVTDAALFALSLFPEARIALVVAAGDYDWLLRAGAAAALVGGAVVPLAADGLRAAEPSHTFDLIVQAPRVPPAAVLRGARRLDVASFSAMYLALADRLPADWPQAIAVANAADREGFFSPSGLSMVGPLVAAIHRAPLFVTRAREAGDIERRVGSLLARRGWRPTHLILVGDELALRSHRVADPAGEKQGAERVRVELFAQVQRRQPQELAVGRIVAENATHASLLLARQIHGPVDPGGPAVFLANADEVFALGETISRTTAAELRAAGAAVRTYYRKDIGPDTIGRALRSAGMLVWEGHPRDLTLEQRGGVAIDRAPPFALLQGCYTLDRSDPFILIEHGTLAIVASSTAVYSAPGSAFARALIDRLLYEGADLGTALRDARNYLLLLAELQRARGHPDWRKTWRAALAFALWGDPFLRPPLPRARAEHGARWSLVEDGLQLEIPPQRLPRVRVGRYEVRPVRRAMLGGLLLRDRDGGDRRILKELFYGTVSAADPVRACPPGPGWDVLSAYLPGPRLLAVLARPDWKRLRRAPGGTFLFPLVAADDPCPGGEPAPPARTVAAGDGA